MALKTKKTTNYLNNRDFLKEIHKSKTSYCYFIQPEYHQYDIIIDMATSDIQTSLDFAMKPEQITQAKENRANRLSAEIGEKINANDIPVTDLIVRVMTWNHIPIAQKEPRRVLKNSSAKDIFIFDDNDSSDDFNDLEDKTTKKEVDDLVHAKVNFPPFQHFKLDENNTWQCVGKSHWIGGINNGHFSMEHGSITNKLARMYMMLCEKYSMKFNWRGYSYRDEMEASAILQLTYVGLRFNEAKSNNPFAYCTAIAHNSFCRILNSEKRVQHIRDDILEANGVSPSLTRQMTSSKTNTND